MARCGSEPDICELNPSDRKRSRAGKCNIHAASSQRRRDERRRYECRRYRQRRSAAVTFNLIPSLPCPFSKLYPRRPCSRRPSPPASWAARSPSRADYFTPKRPDSAAALPTGLSTATPCPRAINPSINHTAALASVDQAEAATHSLVEETSDEGGLGSTHIRVKKRWFQAHQLLQYICAPKIIRNSLFDASEPKIFLASQGRTQIVN